jgi:hypothetical protein
MGIFVIHCIPINTPFLELVIHGIGSENKPQLMLQQRIVFKLSEARFLLLMANH